MNIRFSRSTPQGSSATTSRVRGSKFSVMLLAPVLIFVTLMAWALASPVGASPDDDFHLVSIWCASPNSQDFCLPGTDAQSRVVPQTLVDAPCFAYKPEVSAHCQEKLDFTAQPTTLTGRGNFYGAYPPVFYAAMGVFASNNIEASVIAMRTFTVLLFTALITALYLLLPVRRRPALVWSWVLTTVPLGLFILTSNNPSSWTTMGVGFGWIALLGFFDTEPTRANVSRKILLGGIFVLCALMAAGSRGDGALYSIVGIAAVSILAFSRSRRFLLEMMLPVAVTIMCVGMYRFSRPVASVTDGITSGSTNFLNALINNLTEVPSLWMGVLGRNWGLGWLDTSMPGTIWIAGLACFIGVGFIGTRGMSIRRLVVLAGGALLLMFLPAVLLAAAGDSVGENMQPRYILPLVVMFAGVVMLSSWNGARLLSKAQSILVAATLSITQLVSLHIHMQRYTAGISQQSVNLNDHIEWWWNLPISPMSVWVLGSLAYSALLFVALHGINRLPLNGLHDVPNPRKAAVLRG